jgi:thiol-disulfide isomerase/thioredoxin
MRAGKFEQALKDYDKANKTSGEKCSLCMLRMAFAKLYLRDEKGALKLADASLAAASNAAERADAYAAKGRVLLGVNEAEDKNLAAAEEAFRNARKEDPASDVFQLHLGKVLLRENRLDEGKKELEGFLQKTPAGNSADAARQWLKYPTKVKYSLAPEFQVTTIKGEEVTSKSLAGRVVVIDFWATWCPPCRASVPELKDLSVKYPKDKMVIISVSSDSDQDKWKTFVADKQMLWPQYLDSDHHMTKLFNVHEFPTYIIIDGDGFVRERFVDFDPKASLAHRLKEPLKKMLE